MSIAKKSAVVIMVIVLCGLLVSAASADDLSRSRTDANKMMHKLGRGIVNVLTGWMEVPKNISVEWKKSDPFSGIVMGTVKGLGWTLGRTMSGAYDVVTFPLPIPENYEPLMEAELILPEIWGADFPHYDQPL